MVKKYTPSKHTMDLLDYYKVEDNRMLMIFQNEMSENKALYLDNTVYVDYDTVINEFNKRFYWDANENTLTYTTPTEVIRTEVGSNNYYINRSKSTLPYQIVKTDGDSVYIALDYIKLYTNVEYEVHEKPNRVVIRSRWGQDYMYSEVKKATQLRIDPDIKSDILTQLASGDRVIYMEAGEDAPKSFSKVITKDGIIGYVKNKSIKQAYHEKLENDYQEEQYTHITRDTKINLVWHQVFNSDANNNLLNLLGSTKGVTTVSPTWFSLTSSSGDISSLASETYVERAHNAGVEVWALVDDFNKDVDKLELFSHTSSRDKLINELIAKAIQYNLDGINIDFEKITEKSGPHYIQFLRELSVKCRNNRIILSVDSYPPAEWSYFYDRAEQGVIADYVTVMAYNEHYAGGGESGSVASISFIQNAIDNILKEVPAEQVIIAIPFYTRLWQETKSGDQIEIDATDCGMGQGMNYLSVNGVEPVWDDETGQYYGEYEKDGSTYRIWLEEDKSIELKMKAIDAANVAGVAGWKLGLEKESIWNEIVKYVN